ncbi:acyl carrier protein [Paenibacillus thailandensis]|uniref:Acyl carrier protein n=1 Tax=Paenibacillus thailandensis TaxID=393250 RepID=A0ABW5R392_9BACL
MSTETMDVVARVKQTIANVLNAEREAEDIPDDALIYDDLGIDSIDAIDLVLQLEEEFQVKLGDAELAKDFYSVRTVADKIRQLI